MQKSSQKYLFPLLYLFLSRYFSLSRTMSSYSSPSLNFCNLSPLDLFSSFQLPICELVSSIQAPVHLRFKRPCAPPQKHAQKACHFQRCMSTRRTYVSVPPDVRVCTSVRTCPHTRPYMPAHPSVHARTAVRTCPHTRPYIGLHSVPNARAISYVPISI